LNKGLVIDTLLNNKVGLSRLVADEIEIKEIDLLKKLNQYFDIVKRSATEVKPHLVANYLFELAQVFSSFYESTRVLADIDVEPTDQNPTKLIEKLSAKAKRRLVLIELVAQVLKHGLWLLGIETVEKM
jgi:arginyl-tRNA synthetase